MPINLRTQTSWKIARILKMSKYHSRRLGRKAIAKIIRQTRKPTKGIAVIMMTLVTVGVLFGFSESWESILSIPFVASVGGMLVLLGLAIEKEAENAEKKCLSELGKKVRLVVLRKEIGWWILIVGISAEVVLGLSASIVDGYNVWQLTIKAAAMAPRHLTDGQKRVLAKKMSAFPSSFQLQISDPHVDLEEAKGIAQDIRNSLIKAGWKYDGPITGGTTYFPTGFPAGIGVIGPSHDVCSVLVETLTNLGVFAHLYGFLSYGNSNDVVIAIGHKPPPK